MARYTGKGGIVKAGAEDIGEIRDWSIEETNQVINQPALNDDWDVNTPGRGQWSASINVYLDDADDGQITLIQGAELTFAFYQRGEGSGMKYKTGQGIVAQVMGENEDNGSLIGSYQITGNGPLTESTVT